jgi:hypothetical protein
MLRTIAGLVPAPAGGAVDPLRLRQFADLPRRSVAVPLKSVAAGLAGRAGASGVGGAGMPSLMASFGGPAAPPHMASLAPGLQPLSASLAASLTSSQAASASIVTSHPAFALSSGVGPGSFGASGSFRRVAPGALSIGGGSGTGALLGGSLAGGFVPPPAPSGHARLRLDLSQELALASASQHSLQPYHHTAPLSVAASSLQPFALSGGGLPGLAPAPGAAWPGALEASFLGGGMGGGGVLTLPEAGAATGSFAVPHGHGAATYNAFTPGHGLRPSRSHADRTAAPTGRRPPHAPASGGDEGYDHDDGDEEADTSLAAILRPGGGSGGGGGRPTPATAYRSMHGSMLAVAATRTPAATGGGANVTFDLQTALSGAMDGDDGAMGDDGSGGAVLQSLLAAVGPGVPILQPGLPQSALSGGGTAAAPGTQPAVVLGVRWPGVPQMVWVGLRPPAPAGVAARPRGAPAAPSQAAVQPWHPTLADAVAAAGDTLSRVLGALIDSSLLPSPEQQHALSADALDAAWRAAQAAHAALAGITATGDLRAVVGGVLYPLDTRLGDVSGLAGAGSGGSGGGNIISLMRVGPVSSPQPPQQQALLTVDDGNDDDVDGRSGAHAAGGDFDMHRGGSGGNSLAPTLGRLAEHGYRTEPPLELLAAVPEAELAAVPDFTVYRLDEAARQAGQSDDDVPAFGAITWPGDTDVRCLDLERILRIERGDVVVYRDPESDVDGSEGDDDEDGVTERRPPPGVGLNKSAVVTLEGVFPDAEFVQSVRDAGYRGAVTDAEVTARFSDTLRRHCEGAMGAVFQGYEPSRGVWRFALPHFEPPAERR